MKKAETSLERMLRVLDVIEDNESGVTSDEMLQSLGFTRSTLYRYLKILSTAGLITSLPGVGYTYGPRIAELDYRMRLTDPLVMAARPVMIELVSSMPSIALLCRLYRDKVLCVHQEHGANHFTSKYERGRARPLTRGAASRVILAHLPSRTVARLFEQDPQSFVRGRLGKTLPEVKATLRAIRQRGWDQTVGQLGRGVVGIAAPVFDNRGAVLGSLGLTVGKLRLTDQESEDIARRVTFCARIVSKAVAGSDRKGDQSDH
jgi:DNA-binding IclR family transcriptional regulator